MIYDNFRHVGRYKALLKHFDTINEFIHRGDLHQLPLGRMDLTTGVYAAINDYTTKPAVELRWEAHRKYMDIQFLLQGEERIGYSAAEDFTCIEPYDEGKDIAFYQGQGDYLPLGKGYFIVLFPGEYHKPGIMVDTPALVRKVVIKVLC